MIHSILLIYIMSSWLLSNQNLPTLVELILQVLFCLSEFHSIDC